MPDHRSYGLEWRQRCSEGYCQRRVKSQPATITLWPDEEIRATHDLLVMIILGEVPNPFPSRVDELTACADVLCSPKERNPGITNQKKNRVVRLLIHASWICFALGVRNLDHSRESGLGTMRGVNA